MFSKRISFVKLYKRASLLGLFFLAALLIGILIDKYSSNHFTLAMLFPSPTPKSISIATLQEQVTPKKGYTLPISWNTLGKQMIVDGVIDEKKLAQSVVGKDELPKDYEKYLDGSKKNITITPENAHFWLNVLWGLGLADKNIILDSGAMQTQSNNDPSQFASTGGYTLGVADPMSYYSKSSYISLSQKQQALVDDVSSNIYRPCCGNSTAFPDCNHGMAMLGLLELMASQNMSKQQMYKIALEFNSYWFPQTYLDIAYHFQKTGQDYATIPPQEILSKTFSSATGYAVIQKEVSAFTTIQQKGGSCGA